MIAARILEEGRRLHTEASSARPIVEYLRVHAGVDSEMYQSVRHTAGSPLEREWIAAAKASLAEWLMLAERGLVGDRGGLLGARFEAATDLMEQVQILLDDKQIHPAAPVMLAGAALEQALRGLVESKQLTVARTGIGGYSDALRTAKVVTRQQKKDIDSWGGLRNSAAHGEFDSLSLDAAQLMAMGVNLFLQQVSVSD